MIKTLNSLDKGVLTGHSMVTMSASQSLANGTFTKHNFGTVVYDYNNCWDNSNKRFVIPSGAKYARISFNVYWQSSSTGTRWTEVRKNGTAAFPGVPRLEDKALGDNSHNGSSAIIPVVGGDYFEVWSQQDSGSTLSIDAANAATQSFNWFSIEIGY